MPLDTKEHAVFAMPAGLECGLRGGKYPVMARIAVGPRCHSPFSPDERCYIPSAKKFYEYLLAVLAAIPVKK